MTCSQQVDIREFVDGCMRYRGDAKAIDVAKLQRSLDELSKFLKTSMQKLKPDDIDDDFLPEFSTAWLGEGSMDDGLQPRQSAIALDRRWSRKDFAKSSA